MAKASFFVNHLKVRKKNEFLIIEAKKMCRHGTVSDEVFLTIPAEWATLFTKIEQTQDAASLQGGKHEPKTIVERFKRFSSENLKY